VKKAGVEQVAQRVPLHRVGPHHHAHQRRVGAQVKHLAENGQVGLPVLAHRADQVYAFKAAQRVDQVGPVESIHAGQVGGSEGF
jgi:hypothetical protein